MTETVTRVWSLRDEGAPVHAVNDDLSWGSQAWCGAQAQFRHWQRPGSANAVTCPKCIRALTRGTPYARGSR